MNVKRLIIVSFLVIAPAAGFSQGGFSVATDIGLLRNMGEKQKFWSLGQTVQLQYHAGAKSSFYTWFKYFLPGKFSNSFIAAANDPATMPASVPYVVDASWAYREFSIGYKHYLRGDHLGNKNWSLYGLAGLGLMFAEAENTTTLDTTLYAPSASPLLGSKNFTRLNLDLGIGGEIPLGGNIFLYSDLRTWINTSDYPVEVFHADKNATLPLMLHLGVRLLFE